MATSMFRLVCDPRHLRQQFADDLVAVGGDSDAFPRSHEVGDHLRSHGALPRPGRPLDGQVALVHRLHEATGCVLSVLAVTEKGMTFALTQPGWTTSEQVAWRAVRSRSVKTVLQHEVGEALQALWALAPVPQNREGPAR